MKKNVPLLSLIVILPVVLGVVTFGQFIEQGRIIPKLYLINFIVAFICATLVIAAFPLEQTASGLSKKLNKDLSSPLVGILLNVVINLALAVFVGLAINILNVVILGGNGISDAVFAWLKGFVPVFFITFIISTIFVPVYGKVMEKKGM